MKVDKKKFRDAICLFWALLLSPIYIPHLLLFFLKNKSNVAADVEANKFQFNLNLNRTLSFLYLIHNNSYFRKLFYYRMGPMSCLISWYRKGDPYFLISYSSKIGKGMRLFHPYATVLNAESIGDNFSCLHLVTLGGKGEGRPIIGNNVALGANVTVIGDVRIGDNAEIGAGSVVVKDVPDNAIVVGNPGRVIKYR